MSPGFLLYSFTMRLLFLPCIFTMPVIPFCLSISFYLFYIRFLNIYYLPYILYVPFLSPPPSLFSSSNILYSFTYSSCSSVYFMFHLFNLFHIIFFFSFYSIPAPYYPEGLAHRAHPLAHIADREEGGCSTSGAASLCLRFNLGPGS